VIQEALGAKKVRPMSMKQRAGAREGSSRGEARCRKVSKVTVPHHEVPKETGKDSEDASARKSPPRSSKAGEAQRTATKKSKGGSRPLTSIISGGHVRSPEDRGGCLAGGQTCRISLVGREKSKESRCPQEGKKESGFLKGSDRSLRAFNN